MAASGTARVQIETLRVDEFDRFARDLADAHREVKKIREQARWTDRKLARLTESTYALLGIEYRTQRKEDDGT